MKFNAVEPKVPLLLLFFMTFTVFLVSRSFTFLFIAILFLIFTNVKYQFEMNENGFSLTTSLFGLNLLKRTASKENIKCIEFKRIDGHKKAVFIQLEKGARWKLIRFQPVHFDEYIEEYAVANAIEIKKHKNY